MKQTCASPNASFHHEHSTEASLTRKGVTARRGFEGHESRYAGEQGRPGGDGEDRLPRHVKGGSDVVAGLKNRLQIAMAGVTPKEMLAEQHRKRAERGTAQRND